MASARATAPKSGATAADADEQKQLSYESAATLMAHGSYVLHEHISSKLETAFSRAFSQMEARFSNLSLSADVVVFDDKSSVKSELPTLVNSVKKSLSKLSTKKHVSRKEILKNVSGAFKPGTITLVLGQPGSGKLSLMKILSDRFPLAKSITVEGDVSYNGVPQQEIVKCLLQFAAYRNQRDKHFPTLTVKETLEAREENLVALAAAKALFEHYPEIIIQQLGLENCQDTIVGNAMLRGVSGGERKRVTTGEMEFGMKNVTLMDEISTGLDSAATYDIIRTQRSIAKKFRKTVVIAFLQPAPEVFALFDDVIITNDGEVMYHGPRAQAVDYFESLGFVCPPHRDVADFLLDLGTNQEYAYQVALPADVGKGSRYAHEFAEIFRRSVIYKETLEALEAPLAPKPLANIGVHMNPIFFTFMGFNPPSNAIPAGYKWLYEATPQRYPLAILASLVFADCPDLSTWDPRQQRYIGGGSQLGCRPVRNTPVGIDHSTMKEYVESVFHMKHADIGYNFGMLLLFIVIFRVLALLSLCYLNHQKR